MVDTLLLLRPTQSPVLFQQQIGRGLRLAPGKESCLVLDFVGQHRTEFRFDRVSTKHVGIRRSRFWISCYLRNAISTAMNLGALDRFIACDCWLVLNRRFHHRLRLDHGVACGEPQPRTS